MKQPPNVSAFRIPQKPVETTAAPAVAPATAERFLSAGRRRRASGGGERLHAYVPPELAEELRVKCARERRSVSDAVTAALAAWLR